MKVSVFDWSGNHLADVEADVSEDKTELTLHTSDPNCHESILCIGNYAEIEGRRVRIDQPREWTNGKVISTLYEVGQ